MAGKDRSMRPLRFLLYGSLLLTLAPGWATAQEQRGQAELKIPEVVEPSPFLQRAPAGYRNYALRNFTNPPDHSFPFAGRPQAYFGSMGSYLITGYEVYTWSETRLPGQQFGSRMFKDLNAFRPLFDHVMVARDSWGDRGVSAIVGDGLIARFTPLTLSKVDFNGLRLDLATPDLEITALASRLERQPANPTSISAPWNIEGTFVSDSNTLLLGGRAQTRIGALRLGLNGVNLHVYQSTRPGNSLKGRVRPDHPLIEFIMVRVADDSPADGHGAVVQELSLVLDGEVRPDLPPQVIRHRSGVPTQVGSVSRNTGEFRPVIYTRPSSIGYYSFGGGVYYRGREVPHYADYLYRMAHESGQDVSASTNLEGLLANYAVEPPGSVHRADGDEVLIYMFDLRQEPAVRSVEVETLIGSDYRIDVAVQWEKNATGRNFASQFTSTYYHTVRRAPGNVRDLSNLERVRFHVGENTALFVYGADANFSLAGLEINGEYARSAVYARYPAHQEGERRFGQGPRFAARGDAFYLQALRWFGRGRVGAEYFSMQPNYTTELRTYLKPELTYDYGDLAGLTNATLYWRLVQDNEDADRYPDAPLGHILGAGRDAVSVDPTGVFPGQDEDNDGWPDTNRNFNSLPDYEEPFLMFDVEPNDYTYGLDRNNNGEPDHREDDWDADLPYDPDQRGGHLFGQVDLTRGWTAVAGRYAVGQVAGAGRNRSTYAILSYRREGVRRLRRLFLENHLRRVQDDIADEYLALWERPDRGRVKAGDGGLEINVFSFFNKERREDLLLYRDSWVNETYLEGGLNPWSSLHLVQKVRLLLNWQQGGEVVPGTFQRRRRLDYWTVSSRAQYTWSLGRLSLTPQYKFMLLRLLDQEAGTATRSEWRSIPILRLEYPLMDRVDLRMGLQGMGPFPYRLEDNARRRLSFEQRTAFVSLTNRSRYFGYNLFTIIGLMRNRKDFDNPFRQADEFHSWSFFVRTLIGFTEYGRLY